MIVSTSFSATSVSLLDRVRSRAMAAAAADGDQSLGLPFIELLPIIMDMVAKFLPILASCRKPPPPVPPVPPELVAAGVKPDTFKQAFLSKYAAMESVEGDGFTRWAITHTTTEVKKSQKVKRKAARPIAISALETGRDEDLNDLAIGLQDVKNNAKAMGF